MPDTYEIDLLRGHKKRFADVFLKWALTVGRFLVIITETTALAVFAWRFSLDRQIVDLHDTIKQEQTIVSHLSEQEETFRNLQDRLALAKKVDDQGADSLQIFEQLLSFTTDDISIAGIVVNRSHVSIDVTTLSISALSEFVEKLKTYPDVISVSVDKVENKTRTSMIIAAITMEFAPTDAITADEQQTETGDSR